MSIYGAWLDDEPPHYVREYVEGRSLRDRLEKGGLADTSIDFIQQVLAAVGKAMTFAMSVDVWDLGIEPEKVIVQEPRPGARLGLSAYHVVVCPGPGGSDYIRSGWSRRDGPWSRLYAPPEYTRSNPIESDADQANQYRLGLIGYELLIGSGNFRTVASSDGLRLTAGPRSRNSTRSST